MAAKRGARNGPKNIVPGQVTIAREKKIIAALSERGPMNLRKIRNIVGGSPTTLHNTMVAMVEMGDLAAWRIKGLVLFGLPHDAPDQDDEDGPVFRPETAPDPTKVGANGETVDMVGGDPTHRVVRFTNLHKPGKALTAPVRGLGGHSSLESVYVG